MPRDVRTRWNSTYTMLDFSVKYQAAIQEFTSNLKLGLRKYELDNEEWELAEQLRDVLKVREYYNDDLVKLPDNVWYYRITPRSSMTAPNFSRAASQCCLK